jgi:hypothetical protein
MDGDFGEDGYDDEYVEVSVPTELIKRLINAISEVMQGWEKESGGEFTALIGNTALHIATDFIDASMAKIQGETMQ